MRSSACVIDYRGTFRFDVPPEELWQSLERPERFELWWGWLEDFGIDTASPDSASPDSASRESARSDHDGGDRLVPGSVLHGVVAPPLPYRMRVQVVLQECTRPAHIAAAVHGDLEGHATLVLEAADAGTAATVTWTIEMMQPPMRLAARVASPLLRWGHDRVVDATVASFRRQLASAPRRRQA